MLASLLLCLPLPLPQDPAPPPVPPAEEPEPEHPGIELPGAPLQDPIQEALKEVDRLADLVRDGFRKVDTGLRGARDLVSGEAGEPPAASTPPNAAGEGADADANEATAPASFEEGLDRTVADSDQLLADMEELLAAIPDIKGDGQSSGGKPSDRPEDGENQDASHEKPQQPDEQQAGEEQQEGDAQPPSSYLRLLFDQGAGSWGTLPPRLQEALQNAVMEDLPLRYRRWLDDFHRR